MAQKIVFKYADIESAAAAIDSIAGQYREKAAAFISATTNAAESWKGDTKDAFIEYISTGSVYKYISVQLPEMVEALATVLRGNATAMNEADNQIASSIRSNIQ
jgi:Uncharacterized protein conserved in bacteria